MFLGQVLLDLEHDYALRDAGRSVFLSARHFARMATRAVLIVDQQPVFGFFCLSSSSFYSAL